MRNVLLVGFLSLFLVLPSALWAADYYPDTVAELESAIADAASNTTDDVIYLSATTYSLTGSLIYDPEDLLANTTPGTLSIFGTGSGSTIIEGDGSFRLLYIETPTTNPTLFDFEVSVSGITFTGGLDTTASGTPESGGGGLSINTGYGAITVDDCVFSNNTTSTYGGGLKVRSSNTFSNVSVVNCVFTGNLAQGGGGGASVFAGWSRAFVRNNLFEGNVAENPGTGAGSGGGLHANAGRSRLYIDKNVFRSNRAGAVDGVSGVGGGLVTGATNPLVSGDTQCNLTNNVFIDNYSSYGGGMHVNLHGGKVTALGNGFFRNMATTRGGGLNLATTADAGEIDLYNNLFWENQLTDTTSYDLYIDGDADNDQTPATVVVNTNRYDTATFEADTSETVSGTITDTPLFVDSSGVDPLVWDFSHAASSPVIDAGTDAFPLPSMTVNDGMGGLMDSGLDSVPRQLDGDNDGTGHYDIGPYEYRYAGEQLTASPAKVGFGDTVLNATESDWLLLTNSGVTTLTINSLAISGTDASLFDYSTSVVTPCTVSTTLATDESCNLLTRFTPTSTGAKSAQLDVGSTDSARNPLSISLAGTGINDPVELSPATHDFGEVTTHSSSGTTITLLNGGATEIDYYDAYFTGGDSSEFYLNDSNCSSGGTVYAFASCDLSVSLSPATDGAKATTLEVVTSSGTYTANLTGAGVGDADGDYYISTAYGGDDCNDNNATVHPDATETCNGLDDNCDLQIDEGVTSTFYLDSDTDGYGDPSATEEACTASTGYVADNTDCDDSDLLINPGAAEACNDIDDDCNALIDDGLDCTVKASGSGGGGGGCFLSTVPRAFE